MVGYPHEMKGQGIYAYVTLKAGIEPTDQIRKELVGLVRKEIGPFASPDLIQWASYLPKTRSGKIMRRLLKDIAEGRPLGDTTTLRDPAIVEDIKQQPGGFGDRCVVLHEEHALVHGRLRRYPTAAPVMRRPPGRERSFTPASALGAMQRPPRGRRLGPGPFERPAEGLLRVVADPPGHGEDAEVGGGQQLAGDVHAPVGQVPDG